MRIKLGILGFGKLSQAIARGVLASDLKHVKISATKRKTKGVKVKNVALHTDNRKLVQKSDVILLGVKPYQAQEVLAEIKDLLSSKKILISICAGITTEQLTAWSGGKCQVIRTMPNLATQVRASATSLCRASKTKPASLKLALRLFSAVGLAVEIQESQFDVATALAGSGPAFAMEFVRGLIDAAIREGLDPKAARHLGLQAFEGSALYALSEKVELSELISRVATPGGCTIEGLKVLEASGSPALMDRVIAATAARSRELGQPKT